HHLIPLRLHGYLDWSPTAVLQEFLSLGSDDFVHLFATITGSIERRPGRDAWVRMYPTNYSMRFSTDGFGEAFEEFGTACQAL
ncbi:MAG: hypothetical protein OXE40_06460, partial [Gammaproteobacteria bacterium]|nr:hypothetical protein [Gammaproteobacteria bacterium]